MSELGMTVADSGSPGWLEQNALDRHPDSADVDAILRRLKADGVNFIVGCVYHDGGEAIIEVRGILLPSHRSDETRRPLTFYQDRLGTDIGKALRNQRDAFFLQGLERLDFTPHAAAFTSTVDVSTYQRRVNAGWWQGQYALGVSPWHSSLTLEG
jgi:hypothetical protein